MRRQIPAPSHLKVAPGYVPHRFLGGVISEADAVGVNHYPPSSSEKLIPAIPGFRTSAAFLTSLSANLRIDPDLPSPLLTPSGFRTSSSDFIPPSSLSYSTITQYPTPYPSADTAIMSTEAPQTARPPTDGLPQLSTYTAETEQDRVDGLRLVADSVAQQRQVASKILIFHPINLAAYFLLIALVAQRLYTDTDSLFLIATTVGGLTMAFLVAVRWATARYITLAEDINWEWLGEDRLIVVKWGEEVIGALVLGWAEDAAKKPRGGRRRRGKAVVRAWTVRLKYRGKGVGEGLLEEAVKVAGERGADGILFERDHANSHRILPSVYNGFMNEKEAKAEKMLEKVADEKGNFRQRRSSPTWGSR